MKNALILVTALFISFSAVAQIPEPQKGTYVNDFAGVLTKDEVTNLNKEIFDIEKQANVQMAIVLVKTLPVEYDIKRFAVEIGKQWHIGKTQNGLVYVVAIGQHQQRIEVAKNLTQFPVEKCAEIMTALKPYYQSENYGEGLQILVDKVKAELQVQTQQAAAAPTATAPTDPAAYQTTQDAAPQGDKLANVVGFAVVLVVIVLVIVIVNRRSRKQREADAFFNNSNANYNVPNQGYPNQGYPNQGYPNAGYPNQPDHTLRDIATGAIIGAAVGYAADSLLNNVDDQNIIDQNYQDNNDTDQPYDAGTQTDQTSNDDDNNSSNWGNWGDSGGSDSSFDSGFSDSSDSGGSSDW